MHTVNEATGVVTLGLEGKSFELHASMGRVAKAQSELGVRTFTEIHEAVARSDLLSLLIVFRALCVTVNAADVENLRFGASFSPVVDAVYAALSAGLPSQGKSGNADATGGESSQLPGRDTGNSPSA